LGIIFLSDNNDILKLRIKIEKDSSEDIVHFKRLAVLEFTSDRKRMSVVVMDKTGQIWLYTKGAESHVLPLCKNRNGHFVNQVQNHVNEFAREGLRTLAVARRKLTKLEYISFSNELIEANNSLTNRGERVEVCQRKVETGLELLGATAVEDACKFPGHSQF
jgi:phospholipid-translocating ATPase